MKSKFARAAAFTYAMGCVLSAQADPPPQPHGGTPPVHYINESTVLEANPDDDGTMFEKYFTLTADDVVIGWVYDPQVEVYLASSPTVAINGIEDPRRFFFFAYHDSQVALTNTSVPASLFYLHDGSTLKVGSGSTLLYAKAEDASRVTLVAGSRLVDSINLYGSASLSADSTLFPDNGSVTTEDQATATISTSSGRPSVGARGSSSITVDNTNLRASGAGEQGLLTISQGDVSSLSAGDTGIVNMTGGRAGGIYASGGGTINLTGVADVNDIEVGRVNFPEAPGVAVLAMTGGTLNAPNVKVFNKGSISIDGVTGSLRNVNVASEGELNIVGASPVTARGSLIASGKSKTNFKNVNVTGDVTLSDTAAVMMDTVDIEGRLVVSGSSSFTTSGSVDVNGGVFAFGANPVVKLSSGFVFSIVQIDGSGGFLNLAGANVIGPVNVYGNAIGNIDAGRMDGDVSAGFTSRLVIGGGTVAGNLYGFGSSTIFMKGGHVAGTPFIGENAELNWSGGTFGLGGGLPPGVASASFASDGPLDMGEAMSNGSTPLTGLIANQNSVINVIGYDLESVLIDPEYVNPDNGGLYSVYQLIGRLADGTPLEGAKILVANETNASFNLLLPPVPEPRSLTLLVGLAIGGRQIAYGRRRPRVQRRRQPCE